VAGAAALGAPELGGLWVEASFAPVPALAPKRSCVGVGCCAYEPEAPPASCPAPVVLIDASLDRLVVCCPPCPDGLGAGVGRLGSERPWPAGAVALLSGIAWPLALVDRS
jgi:hypothetical protein